MSASRFLSVRVFTVGVSGLILAACGTAFSLPGDVACGSLVYSSDQTGNWDIYSLTGDRRVQLTAGPGNDVNPSWSPDGDRILFTSISGGRADLYVMAADGSALEALTRGLEFESSSDWSPDGSTVVFDRVVDDDADLTDHDATDFAQVFVAPFGLPLGAAIQLTTGEPNAKPVWSPGGDQIAFLSWRDGNAEVYLMNADGADQTNLSHSPGFDGLPSWSPDGSRIAFVSDRDGRNQIYVMNADGSGPAAVTHHAGSATNPSWSSDGRHILFTLEGQPDTMYVVPSTGGEAVRVAPGFTHDCRP